MINKQAYHIRGARAVLVLTPFGALGPPR